jgi:hypothetical protein
MIVSTNTQIDLHVTAQFVHFIFDVYSTPCSYCPLRELPNNNRISEKRDNNMGMYRVGSLSSGQCEVMAGCKQCNDPSIFF